MQYLIPALFLCVTAFAAVKRVNVYAAFSRGAGEAVKFTLSLIPLLVAVFCMCELFEASGLSNAFSRLVSPLLELLGIPAELSKLMLVKPFSGSGSLAYLTRIIESCGADSYIARCACVTYGSSETVFYVLAVYFASSKQKRRLMPVAVILLSTFISTVFSCALCRIL